jgi:hypothetical protein
MAMIRQLQLEAVLAKAEVRAFPSQVNCLGSFGVFFGPIPFGFLRENSFIFRRFFYEVLQVFGGGKGHNRTILQSFETQLDPILGCGFFEFPQT